MIFCDELIFLHLQKTGGNHVAKLLSRYFTLHQEGKHNGIVGDISRPYVLVGIRNPWDWYVSLWAYGCQREGSLWSYMTSGRARSLRKALGNYGASPGNWFELSRHIAALPGKDGAFWRDLYRDPEDPERFRRWVRAVHSAPTSHQTGEEFSALPLSRQCGLMTSRYLKVSSRESDWVAGRRSIRTVGDAVAYRDAHSVATHFIRTEQLEADLHSALSDMGVAVEDAGSLVGERTNRSKHHAASYYYDDATAALVAQRDRLIIEAHGYQLG